MDNEDSRTIWCGNLSERITEELLYELFLQSAPIQKVKIPKDKSGRQSSYGFVTFKHVESVPYSLELLNGISVFNRRLNLKARMSNSNNQSSYENPQRQQIHQVNETIDPRKLISYGDQMQLSKAVATNYDNYGGNHHHSSSGRWERNTYNRDEKRTDTYPYNRNERGHGNNHTRRNYESGSNYHNRNRRRY